MMKRGSIRKDMDAVYVAPADRQNVSSDSKYFRSATFNVTHQGYYQTDPTNVFENIQTFYIQGTFVVNSWYDVDTIDDTHLEGATVEEYPGFESDGPPVPYGGEILTTFHKWNADLAAAGAAYADNGRSYWPNDFGIENIYGWDAPVKEYEVIQPDILVAGHISIGPCDKVVMRNPRQLRHDLPAQ